jgi:hypothetical protein
MAALDWSVCPAVESIPGKVSGAWVFKAQSLRTSESEPEPTPVDANPL